MSITASANIARAANISLAHQHSLREVAQRYRRRRQQYSAEQNERIEGLGSVSSVHQSKRKRETPRCFKYFCPPHRASPVIA